MTRDKAKAKTGSAKSVLRFLLITLAVLVVSFVVMVQFAYRSPAVGREVQLSSVYRLADAGQIVSARLLDEDAEVVARRRTGCAPTPTAAPAPVEPGGTPAEAAPPKCSGPLVTVRASYPASDVATQQLIDRLTDGDAAVVVDKQTAKAVVKLVVTFVLPLLILANLFGLIFLSRSNDSPMNEIAGFGRIGREQKRKRGSKEVTFADVAGVEEAVVELREVIDYLKDPKKFEEYGAAPPKGVLLFGPPGCGKTLLARAVAGETGVPFISISGAEFVESLVGVGAARVRDLFRQVGAVAPAIVFIDEIDAVGRRRGIDVGSSGEREQTVNQLLVEIDGFEVTSGIVVMGATNRPDILDPALLRPGRFDRHITLEPPDVVGRREILELHAAARPIAPDVDFEALARATPGFTGADLANVINEGALLALRGGGQRRPIDQPLLAEAIQRVLHGPQRRGRLITAEERKRIAFHEAGHAVLAAASGRAEELHRVSVVARGQALGQAMVGEPDRVLLTTSEMYAQLSIAMAGVAAEELIFEEASTTTEHDNRRATTLAREMVGRYGMSAKLGRSYILAADEVYLAPEAVSLGPMSGQTMQDFDEEVRRLLGAAEQTATHVLISHRAVLDDLAAALEDAETLEGEALEALLAPVRPEANLFSMAGPVAVKNGAAERRGGRRAKKGSGAP